MSVSQAGFVSLRGLGLVDDVAERDRLALNYWMVLRRRRCYLLILRGAKANSISVRQLKLGVSPVKVFESVKSLHRTL